MYCKRDFICERLRISNWQSYNIFPVTKSRVINADAIIDKLNKVRRNEESLRYIPSDLMTPSEVETALEIPSMSIKKWIHSPKKRFPHFRINAHVIRVRLASVQKWLDKNS